MPDARVKRALFIMNKNLAQAMKLGMRRLVSGVAVLSTRSYDGTDYAMTVSSVTSVSDAPASLLVCVQQSTRIAPELVMGSRFAVNVLKQQHQAISTICSTGDQGEHRFAVGDWDRRLNMPFLRDAEAVFQCEVAAVHPYGTHNIVIGQIIEVAVATDEPDPLVYLNGRYRQLT